MTMILLISYSTKKFHSEIHLVLIKNILTNILILVTDNIHSDNAN